MKNYSNDYIKETKSTASNSAGLIHFLLIVAAVLAVPAITVYGFFSAFSGRGTAILLSLGFFFGIFIAPAVYLKRTECLKTRERF